ncbi:MAG: tRNA (guanine-N7-)-methyltransferase [Kiritimatiellia bacterium]|jgi:tRNA (guanine-N7-)-methyltransferase
MSTRETRRAIPEQWLEPNDIKAWFDQEQPLEIDLGCGKGRFLLERAKQYPEINFLGIERQLQRLVKIDRRAVRRNLHNIRLWRVEGYYATRYLIPENLVDTYYIFFPDPWPKKKHARNRIMSARFLAMVHRTLKPGGVVHFATDHLPYYYDAVKEIQGTALFEEAPPFYPTDAERTDFELHFLNRKPIGRYSFAKPA